MGIICGTVGGSFPVLGSFADSYKTSSRSAVLLKLTAFQVLVFDWIAGSGQDRHLNEAYVFALFLQLDAAKRPYYVTRALGSRRFSCSGRKRFGKYFSAFFAGFNAGLT